MFRAYYCGLCESMGRVGSQISRMGLSYDMTFLLLVLSALDDEDIRFKRGRCAVHPFVSRMRIEKNNRSADYAARMGIILMYLKLMDDWHDDRSIKALAAAGLFKHGVGRAKRGYEDEYQKIREHLSNLNAVEKSESDQCDDAADCFAKILELLFVPKYIKDEAQKRALAWMGYNIGRWIYIIDAFEDMDKNLKKGGYNPFLCEYRQSDGDYESFKRELSQRLSVTLSYTLSQAASAYELLDIKRNKNIIDNVIYLSLRMRQEKILNCESEEKSNGSI